MHTASVLSGSLGCDLASAIACSIALATSPWKRLALTSGSGGTVCAQPHRRRIQKSGSGGTRADQGVRPTRLVGITLASRAAAHPTPLTPVLRLAGLGRTLARFRTA